MKMPVVPSPTLLRRNEPAVTSCKRVFDECRRHRPFRLSDGKLQPFSPFSSFFSSFSSSFFLTLHKWRILYSTILKAITHASSIVNRLACIFFFFFLLLFMYFSSFFA